MVKGWDLCDGALAFSSSHSFCPFYSVLFFQVALWVHCERNLVKTPSESSACMESAEKTLVETMGVIPWEVVGI